MGGNLITIIGGIIVLAIIIGVVTLVIKKKNNNTQAAIEFLEGLGDELLVIIVKTVKEIDPATIDSIEEFEVIVLNSIYDKTWDYVENQINTKLDDDSLMKTIMSIVDKEYVIKFIDQLCERTGITDSIQGEYAAYRLSVNKPEEQEAAMIKEYSDDEKYHEEASDEDLAPAVEPVHSEEEIAALNPQRDEEESYDVEDDSMEMIPEAEEIGKVMVNKDKLGRWLFFEVDAEGKKTRLSKTEAIPRLKEQGDSEEILKEIEG